MNKDLQSIGITTMTVKEIVDILNSEAKLAFERGDYDRLPNDIQHTNALQTLKVLEAKQSFGNGLEIQVPIISGKGRKQHITTYQLNKRQSIALAARLSVDLHMAIIDRWQELESQQPKVPTNFLEAMQLATKTLEQNKVLKLERDNAIKTKAEIGSKREATAMATASVATKENNKLKIELDQSKQYATIKRMQIKTGKTYKWQLLKKAGIDLGIKPKKVDDVNYGSVNSYHKKVWMKAYNLKID